MAVFDYSDPLLAAVNLGTTYGSSFLSGTVVNATSGTIYESYFNPGHGGALSHLEWYFAYRASVSPDTSTGTAKWQFQPATGGAWVNLSTNSSAQFSNAVALFTGVTESTLQVPLRVRWLVTCTGSVYIVRSPLYKWAMRGIGNIST